MPAPMSPDEVQILTGYDDRGSEALVERIIAADDAGVRVELKLGDGRQVWTQLAPEQAEQLELREGQILPVSPVLAS